MKRSTQISKKVLAGLLGLGASVTLAACETPDTTTTAPAGDAPITTESPATVGTSPAPATDASNNVVAVAQSDESFSTLAQAIEAAGLTETLSQDGPYTVFAPTNEAFAALPEGVLDALLLPENQDVLTQVLSYHVVPQEVTSDQITPGEVATVEGESINVQVDQASGDVMVNEAMVVEPDVVASNGVIHAIDQVILPPNLDLAQLQGAGTEGTGTY
ncbi:fasciclin domain-containing protein [Oculatella sp. LEGE 06141]|uniref:fasciclin domain-containing protein n=1 Tax=Oculatella sp. LEGE 06141 TaxID=1828648 RepID=UPI0018806DE2|nr:fasciclin domain-containing protein [Oculatella sp. LEGE 06141]MBE9182089.1 fasciclin domain-containing protein [Oculatella sp. LEGE 06141]